METAGELDQRAPYEKLVTNNYAEKAIEEVKKANYKFKGRRGTGKRYYFITSE